MFHHSNYVDTTRHAIKGALQAINSEISDYPTPISGCDAQFNHLLAQRGQLTNALAALKEDVFIPTPRIPNQGDRVESR